MISKIKNLIKRIKENQRKKEIKKAYMRCFEQYQIRGITIEGKCLMRKLNGFCDKCPYKNR